MTWLLVDAVLAPFVNLDATPHPRDLLTLRSGVDTNNGR